MFGFGRRIKQKRKHRELTDARILGDEFFIREIWAQLEEDKLTEFRASKLEFQELIRRICKAYGIDKEQLLSGYKAKPVTEARAVACYLGCRELGLTATQVAKHLGLSVVGVSRAIQRGETQFDPETKDEILGGS